MVRLPTLLAYAAACGVVGLCACSGFGAASDADPEPMPTPTVDGGTSIPDGESADAPVTPTADGGPCNTSAAWSAPKLVTEMSTTAGDEYGGWLFGNDTFFSRGPSNASIAYRGRYLGGTWKEEKLTYLVTTPNVRNPSLTKDGLRIFAEYFLGGPGRIYHITRATTETLALDNNSQALVGAVGAEVEVAPHVSAGVVWFARGLPTNLDIFGAPLGLDGKPDVPSKIGGVNSAFNDSYPVVTDDSKRMYFASQRSAVTRGYDIFVTTRPNATSPFTEPVLVQELSTLADEYPTWLSPDGCKMYMMRNSAAGAMNHDIFSTTKPK